MDIDFLTLLEKAMADELRTQRLYTAMVLLAPSDDDKAKILEIFSDEVDHSALLEDMMVRYTSGQPGTVAERLGGVE